MPGVTLMAVLTSAVESLGALRPLSGTVAGGILLMLMALVMPAGNFIFYLGIGIVIRKLARALRGKA